MIRRGVTRYQGSAPTASAHFRDTIEAKTGRLSEKVMPEEARSGAQKGTIFFNPFFFFFLLLEISSSVA
jgi:hypothetical protein